MEKFDAVWTQAVLDEILARSRGGEGVAAVITSLGLDPGYGLDWLQKYHIVPVVAAKKVQIAVREEAARAEAAAKAAET